MRPLKLYVENFIGIKKAEVEFEPGVYVLVGRNGSGKSSLFEAIHFALYGKPIRTSTQSSIRMGSREAKVIFEFEFDGKVYEIFRQVKRRGPQIAFLKKDGVREPGESASSITKKIVEMTGIDSKTFTRFFFIPQEKITEVLRFGSDLKTVIMKLIDFEDISKFIKNKIREEIQGLGLEGKSMYLERIENDLEKFGDPESIEKEIKNLEITLKRLKSEERKIEEEINEIDLIVGEIDEEELKKLRNEIERLEKLAKLEERIKKAKELFPLLEEIRSLETEISSKREIAERIERENEELRKRSKELEEKFKRLSEKFKRIESEISGIDSDVENLKTILERVSPILYRIEVLNLDLNRNESELESLKRDLENIEKEMMKISNKLQAKRLELSTLEGELENLRSNEIGWMAWKIASELGKGAECPVCGGTIGEFPESVEFDAEALEKLESDIEKLKAEIGELEAREKILKEKKKETQSRIAEMKKKVDDSRRELEELGNTLRDMGYFEGMYDKLRFLETERKKLEENAKRLSTELRNIEKEKERSLERFRSNAERLESLKKEIYEKAEKLKNMKEKLKENLESAGLTEDEIERLSKEEIQGHSEKLLKIRERLEIYEKRIEEIEKKGYSLGGLIEKRKELVEKKSKIRNEIEKLSTEKGQLVRDLERVRNLMEEISELKREIENLKSEKKILESLSEAFGSTKFASYVFSVVFGKIMEVASSRFYTMTNGRFGLRLRDDGKLEVTTRFGNLEPDQLSGGERTLLALSLITAVSDVLVGKVGLLFVDEGFAALDEFNRELVAGVLREFEVSKRVIIFITHSEDLKDRFERKLIMKDGVLEVG